MPLENGFSERLRLYLHEMGRSRRFQEKLTLDTRLFHDLHIYGDDALSEMLYLEAEFEVDMSGFEFKTYFPGEFHGGNFFVASILPSFIRFRYFQAN